MRLRDVVKFLSVSMIAVVVAGCGGGGGSSTPPAPPPPPPPTYETLQDLEFTTLDMIETWNLIGDKMYTTMKFANTYTYVGAEGKQWIHDETSSNYHIKECSMAPAGVGITYMCLGLFGSGSLQGWGINIDSAGNITGNFEFSIGGNTTEIAIGITDPNYSDAVVTGTAYSNVAKTNGNIASINRGMLGTNIATINEDSKNDEKYVELKRAIPSEEVATQANAELVQQLDEMYNDLLEK